MIRCGKVGGPGSKQGQWEIDEKASYRRLRWRLVPYLLVLYVFAWFGRVNISFATLTLNADLGFSAAAYGLEG